MIESTVEYDGQNRNTMLSADTISAAVTAKNAKNTNANSIRALEGFSVGYSIHEEPEPEPVSGFRASAMLMSIRNVMTA